LSLLQAIVLGVVQGLTEFLPISSSAHLILVPRLFSWPDQGLHFDLALHTGTLLAVITYFGRDLLALARGWLRAWSASASDEDRRHACMVWALLIATVPLLLGGLLLQKLVASSAREPVLIACTSIAFGILLGWVDRSSRRARALDSFNFTDAAAIGAAQVLAIVPGVSRSGITMTAGLLRGLDRATAARFAFLLSIPAGLAVTAKDVLDLLDGKIAPTEINMMIVGGIAAAISGFAVIAWFLRFLRLRSLMGFAVYRVVLGVGILWLM
jgi:undecaprenyl-diphosphatase